MSDLPSYGDSLADTILVPKSLTIVTGLMGSGMTDFALRLLQNFHGRVFLTEYLQHPPENFKSMNRLSEFLAAVAVESQTRKPFAVYIDHAQFAFLPLLRRSGVMKRMAKDGEFLISACRKACASLVVSGSGLQRVEDIYQYILKDWDQVTICRKTRLSTVSVEDFGRRKVIGYEGVPPTNLKYYANDYSVLTADIKTEEYARFFAELLEE